MSRNCLNSAVFCIVLVLSADAVAAEKLPDAPPLTILAWGGPPQDQTTPQRYKELADAGFTHNYSGFGNADEMAKDTNPEVRRLLGAEGNYGSNLGLTQDWALRIVKNVGNYGEVFDRNLGDGSRLKLKRGLNALYNKGGIQYAPPIR